MNSKSRINQVDDLPLRCEAASVWGLWFRQNHASSTGIWLQIAKKGAAEQTVSYPQALETALCFGWIDGQKKSHSDDFWLQRFTPRGPKSIWSKVNRDKALRLIDTGQMQTAGLREVERAQRDGRWEAAYDPQSSATIPADLQAVLDDMPVAKTFFATLNSQNRYAILFRIQTAKKAETRAKRIQQFAQMLARQEKIYP
ncbi:MAG: YdeI/OmpD-associated family protein [Burkholderiaceae bacterium]|nr:YdeI/OmpD-associated family protein [Burkholderiaceae bacterium]